MSKATTRQQVSAGGVVFRQSHNGDNIEVALISVGDEQRWQLPKGIVHHDEEPEVTALREVSEETGLNTEMVGPLDTIEYWYYSTTPSGAKVRFHKYVHFYLLRYLSGNTADHDHEVNEARWFDIDEAYERLAFDNEKQIVAKSREAIEQLI